MRRALAGFGVLALAAAVIAFPPQATLASWSDSEYPSAALAAGTLNPPISVGCSGGGLLSPITFTWSAPATGIVPTGYHWTLATKTLLGPTGSGDVATTSATIPAAGLLGAGTSTFTVISTAGGWTSASGPTGTYGVASVLFVGLVTSCSVP